MTVSIGAAQRLPGESTAAFIERADAALYLSKRGGRDRVTFNDEKRLLAA